MPDDIVSLGVPALLEALEAVLAGPVALGAAPGSTAFEHAASETDSASASAPVKSFFMEGPCQQFGEVPRSSHGSDRRDRRRQQAQAAP